MESIDKLRNTKCEGLPCITCQNLADEIEQEIAERYIELPVDADGEPIRIGDGLVLQYKVREKPSEVESITFDGEDWYFTSSDGFFNTAGFHHVKPRTLEDVLDDFQAETIQIFGKRAAGDIDSEMLRTEYADSIRAYADEIRGLMSTDS